MISTRQLIAHAARGMRKNVMRDARLLSLAMGAVALGLLQSALPGTTHAQLAGPGVLPPAEQNNAATPPPAPQADGSAPPSAAPLPPPAATPPPPVPMYPAPPPADAPITIIEPPSYYGTYTPSQGAAEGPAPEHPGAREHEGFFLRLGLGVGASILGYREAVDGNKLSGIATRGLSGLFNVSVGGRVVGNLIVHGDLIVSDFGDAQREVSGVKDARNVISGTLGMVGGGVTYYLMPSNAFITGIMGVTHYTEQRDGETSIDSGLGVGASTLIGKEWWVGPRGAWGLGAALRASYYWAPMEIAHDRTTLKAGDIGVVCSATFN
jgi:hypothetical protein